MAWRRSVALAYRLERVTRCFALQRTVLLPALFVPHLAGREFITRTAQAETGTGTSYVENLSGTAKEIQFSFLYILIAWIRGASNLYLYKHHALKYR